MHSKAPTTHHEATNKCESAAVALRVRPTLSQPCQAHAPWEVLTEKDVAQAPEDGAKDYDIKSCACCKKKERKKNWTTRNRNGCSWGLSNDEGSRSMDVESVEKPSVDDVNSRRHKHSDSRGDSLLARVPQIAGGKVVSSTAEIQARS